MRSLHSQRGSVLTVALIFAAILAIALTGYLRLSLNALKLSNRSFYSNGAVNLLDIGMEQALWSMNNTNWTGFTALGSGRYQGTFPSSSTFFPFSGGAKGQVKVWIDTANMVSGVKMPHVVAEAIVTLGDGSTVSKMAETYLQQRTYSQQPLVSRTGLSFTGNAYLDSWDSHSDTASTADDVPYSAAVREAELDIASTSMAVSNVSLQNADAYGRAWLGTPDASGISVGSGGRLAGSFGAGTGIDFTRVRYDFTTSFPDVAPETGNITTLPPITGNKTLPNVGDPVTIKDGVTYYIYSVSGIDLNGADKVSITTGYNVIINVTGTIGETVKTTGNAAIEVPAGSILKMFVAADVKIAGNGVQNGGATTATANNPINFQLFGTRSAAVAAVSGMQQFDIKGNGYLSAVVNAPNANVFVNGTAETFGAIFANHVTMVGNGSFHGDRSLKRIPTTGLWEVSKWRELFNAADRSAYATHLAF